MGLENPAVVPENGEVGEANIVPIEEVLKEAGVDVEKETGAEKKETPDSDKPEQPEEKEGPEQTPEEIQALETAREDRIQELRTGLREKATEIPDNQEDGKTEKGAEGGAPFVQIFNMAAQGGGSSAEKPKTGEVKKRKKGAFWRFLSWLFRF